MSDSTPDALIQEHQLLKERITLANKQFEELCAPLKTRQREIESALHEFLLGTGGKNFKGSTGTAYLSTITTPKVVDRTVYLDWILESWDERGEMLQIGAPQVGAFEEYVDTNKAPPPGCAVSFFERLNIRKS